jgi:hypothetical protein
MEGMEQGGWPVNKGEAQEKPQHHKDEASECLMRCIGGSTAARGMAEERVCVLLKVKGRFVVYIARVT